MGTLPPSIGRAWHFIASNGGVRNTLRIVLRKIRRCGVADALGAVASHSSPVPRWPQRRYRRFLRMHEQAPSPDVMAAQLAALPSRPRIAMLAIIGPGRMAWTDSGLRSVTGQAYPEWELWLLVDPAAAAMPALGDSRVRLVVVRRNESALESLNGVLAQTSAEFVARVDLRDRLAPHALLEVAAVLGSDPSADFLYTDEDRLDVRARRTDPQFKPQWSPDTLLSYPYTGDLAVFRRSLLTSVGGWHDAMAPAEDYELALRVSELARRIVRLPKVLYHRSRPVSEGAEVAEATAKMAALARRGVAAAVERVEASNAQRPTLNVQAVEPTRGPAKEDGPSLHHPAVRYAVRGTPLVSIIIPTRNHAEDVRRCLQSIRARTSYPAWEVVVVDNGSDEAETLQLLRAPQSDSRTRCVRLDVPFNFARLNNAAVREARGDVLLFLNNDTEVLSPDWLERMLGFALQPHVGAVGARLLYPDGTLQHSGVAKVGPGPTHVFGRMPEDYPHPRVQLDGNWSAVTGACLMLERRKFEQVGGFDEAFPVAYNDVDLCLHLLSEGYFNVLASRVRLHHREFATRGNDRASNEKRAALESALRHLYGKWPQYRDDPGYNPNLSDSFPDFMPKN